MSSVKEHCCGAELVFDKKRAKKQYGKYLRKGPSRVTARIISQLEKRKIDGQSLIDVGGGIGALQWWFLENGGIHSTGIDASSGYLEIARQHAEKKNWNDQTELIHGDFVGVREKVEKADFVTLDKVICCYPNFQEIIEVSCQKAHRQVSLSYPMGGLFWRIFAWAGGIMMRLKQNAFRPYIHPVREVEKAFQEQGFTLTHHTVAFPWLIQCYERDLEVQIN